MEERYRKAKEVVEAIKLLSSLTEEQHEIVRNALAFEDCDFVLCRTVSQELNQTHSGKQSAGVNWDSHKVESFLSILASLQRNLYSFIQKGEDFREGLQDFLAFYNYPDEVVNSLADSDFENARKLLFTDLITDEVDLVLINGVVRTGISISLETIFKEEEINLIIPIATLRITAQDIDDELVSSCFQLTVSDIDDLIGKLNESKQRILKLVDSSIREAKNAEN